MHASISFTIFCSIAASIVVSVGCDVGVFLAVDWPDAGEAALCFGSCFAAAELVEVTEMQDAHGGLASKASIFFRRLSFSLFSSVMEFSRSVYVLLHGLSECSLSESTGVSRSVSSAFVVYVVPVVDISESTELSRLNRFRCSAVGGVEAASTASLRWAPLEERSIPSRVRRACHCSYVSPGLAVAANFERDGRVFR